MRTRFDGRDAAVVVDARSLQDERFRNRGIGTVCRTLMAGRPRAGSQAGLLGRARTVAVIDPALPPLAPEDAVLFDQVQTTTYLGRPAAAVFLPSPMTHPLVPFARSLGGRAFTAAFVHDFIPLQHPSIYLGNPSERLAYASRLLWLRGVTRFYANSSHTGEGVTEHLQVPPDRVRVVGIGMRASLAGAASMQHGAAGRPYFAVAGGDDWRKNVELPIVAHARSAALARHGVRLVVLGGYPLARMTALRTLHAEAGGRSDLLVFKPRVLDPELRATYEDAIAVIAASRTEGFSIPVVEAALCGTPALASRCPAQLELVSHPDDVFDPDDVAGLQGSMERLHHDPAARQAARDRQAWLVQRFSAAAVCERFWTDFAAHSDAHSSTAAKAPAIGRKLRPSIAFATPVPPAASGVADYSAATVAALGGMADVTVYTDTPHASLPAEPGCGIEPLSSLAYLAPRHDATVSVLGNSHFHHAVFNELMAWGSATIAHDSRMLSFYAVLLGRDRALAAARRELGREVSGAELEGWLANQATLPALFLDEIAAVSRPLLLHSAVTAGMLHRRGLQAGVLPFSPLDVFSDRALQPAARAAARGRLRLDDADFVVATFGNVMHDRAIEDCVGAVEMLRAWKVRATLVCVGPIEPALRAYLNDTVAVIGATPFVRFAGPVAATEYRAWLQAADAAIQLRTYKLGGLSGALLDCMAAALPTVANAHLAEAMDAPPWVTRVPDGISAVLVAEALLAIHESGAARNRPLEGRRQLLNERGFAVYARRLMEALGFEAPA